MWEGMSLRQIELVWFRVRLEWECFWVNLRKDNKGLNPRWQCLNSTWQNSRWLPSSSYVRRNEFEADWISLSQSQSGVRVFWSESEMEDNKGLNPRWQCHLNSTWQNSVWWLPSSSWVRIRMEWSFFVQMVGTNLASVSEFERKY